MSFHGYVQVQGRGVIALPAEVRRRLHLDQAGTQLEITEREDGVLELRSTVPVPADQAWFWTERWQKREREVDVLVAADAVSTDESTDEFLGALDGLAQESTAATSTP